MFNTIRSLTIDSRDDLELEHRCYNVVCLAAGLGCWLAAVFNTTVGLPPMVGVLNFVIGGIYIWLYHKSRRSMAYRPVLWLYIFVGAVLLIVTWLFNGGINGSGTFVSMVALVAMTVVLKQHRLLVVLTVFFPIMSVLFILEYRYSDVVFQYNTTGQRFLDVYLAFVISTAVIFAIIALILQRHDNEKTRLNEANRLFAESNHILKKTNRDLEKAMSQIKTLSGLLPICSGCKKVRDDQGYWNQIESYIEDHSKAEFSHGICPECAKRLYPDLELE